mgnify:CR=1 FL=1
MKYSAVDRGALLRQLIAEGLTTVAELAAVTQRSESTVRRWVRGEKAANVVDLKRSLTGLHSDEARRRIVYTLFDHLPVTITWIQRTSDDDHSEFDHATNALYHIARLMQRMQKVQRAGAVSNDLRVEIQTIIGEAMEELVCVKRKLTEGGGRRKRARVVPPRG